MCCQRIILQDQNLPMVHIQVCVLKRRIPDVALLNLHKCSFTCKPLIWVSDCRARRLNGCIAFIVSTPRKLLLPSEEGACFVASDSGWL